MRADLCLLTDNELAERYRLTGDDKAWGALQEKYQEKISHFVKNRGIYESDVEDIAEEIFIKAFRAISKFRIDGSFRALLYKIARNRCYDKRKEYERESLQSSLDEAVCFNGDAERGELLEDLEPLIEDKIEEEELLNLLDACLDGLNERASEIVELYYGAELNCAEIARMIQLSHGAVQGRVNSAVQILRRCFRLKIKFEF